MIKDKDREYLKKLGGNTKKVRKSLDITQGDLADKTTFHRTYISQIERGVTNPTLLSLQTLAKGLETSVEVLIEGVFSDNSGLPENEDLLVNKRNEAYD